MFEWRRAFNMDDILAYPNKHKPGSSSTLFRIRSIGYEGKSDMLLR